MSAQNTSLRAGLAHGLQSASSAQLLRVAEALLDDDVAGRRRFQVLQPSELAKLVEARYPLKLSSADGRFQRVTEDLVLGSLDEIPEDAWLFTRDQETDLVWTHVLGDAKNGQPHEESVRIAEAFHHRGVNFCMPEIRPVLSILDFDRYDPAVNPKAFRGPYGWLWAKTLCKRNDDKPAVFAWAVYLDAGLANRNHRSYHGLVRGYCPSQSLGLR